MARARVKRGASKKPKGRGKTVARRPVQGRRARSKAGARKQGARTRRAGAANAGMRAMAQRIIDVTLADDDQGMLALYDPAIESSEAGQPPMVGLDGIRGKLAGWRQMVTDTSFEPRRVLVDGNVIVIEWLGRVTLAASCRQAELHEIAVHEIANGKIVREAYFYNPAALA